MSFGITVSWPAGALDATPVRTFKSQDRQKAVMDDGSYFKRQWHNNYMNPDGLLISLTFALSNAGIGCTIYGPFMGRVENGLPCEFGQNTSKEDGGVKTCQHCSSRMSSELRSTRKHRRQCPLTPWQQHFSSLPTRALVCLGPCQALCNHCTRTNTDRISDCLCSKITKLWNLFKFTLRGDEWFWHPRSGTL